MKPNTTSLYNSLNFRFSDLSKKYQLILAISILLILVSVGFSMLLPNFVSDLLLNEFKTSHKAIANMLADNLSIPLSDNDGILDAKAFEQISITTTKSLTDFTHLFVYNENKTKVYEIINTEEQAQIQLFRPTPNKREYIDKSLELFIINQDIIKAGSIIGNVTAVFTIRDVQASIRNFQMQIVLVCIIILIVGICFTFFIANLISKPLDVLLATFLAITRGDLSIRANINSKEEFGQLAKTFNRMVDSLEESYYELAETNKNMELMVEQRTKQLRNQIEVREKAEDKLKLINKTMFSIISASPLPIVALTTDFRIRSISPAFKQIFNHEEYEILGKILPFVYMTDTDYFISTLQHLDSPNKTERLIVKGRKKSGELIDLSIAAVAEFNDDGKINGYITIIDDITEKILFEKALLDNEAKYRALIEDSIVGVGMIGGGNFTFANQALLDIWEYPSKSDFINTSFLEMVSIEDKHKIVELFKLRDESINADIEIPITEIKILCCNGKEKFVQISSNLIMLDRDTFLQMTFVDISDRKQAEHQMKQMNEELEQRVADRTSKLNKTLIDLRIEMSQRSKISKELQFKSKILEHTTSVCIVFNSKGQCIYVSPYSVKVFGWELDNLIGMGIWQNTNINVVEGDSFSIGSVMSTLESNQEPTDSDFIIQIITPNKTTKYLQLSSSIGQNNTLITAGAEITEQVKAQQALKVMSDKLAESLESEKELNLLKTRFISMVSHEFRNPLAIILNCSAIVDQAIENKRPEIATQYLEKINKSVKTMNNLMEDVLIIGKTQSKKVTQVEEINFVDFVKTSLDDIQAAYSFTNTANVDVKNNCTPFYSNEDTLKRIVHNLITNALKYTTNGQPVQITIDQINDKIEFVVADKGIGIPEQELKQLFTNFFRASNVGKIAGTGLGLNIVKQSVDNLYGEIFVESTVNVGTTFRVLLPMDIRDKITSFIPADE